MSFLFSCFACVAFAQAAASPPAPPAAAKESYASPFADYRRFDAESPPKPWRRANDEVREAGGHVGILKGMSAPAASSATGKSPPPDQATPPAEPKKPAAHSHGSHR